MNIDLKIRSLACAGLIAMTLSVPGQGNPFAEGVRTTPWLSPEDEAKSFHLPDGFEIPTPLIAGRRGGIPLKFSKILMATDAPTRSPHSPMN